MKLWQLKNPQTGENIDDPQPLPENWGPIFGMHGIKDRLGDLSWLGIFDKAWVEVEVPDPPESVIADVTDRMLLLIEEVNQKIMNDKSLTKAQWQAWVEYQKQIQNIPLQPKYPKEVLWPTKPE